MVQYRPPIGSTTRARRLRRNPTDAETRMWRLLRRCFPDAHFRQQVPIRDFIAGFASHGLRLVIEVDGGQHGSKKDKARTALIEAEGYRVIRFWNHDVLAIPKVSLRCWRPIAETPPPPNPPPSRGRA